MRGQIDLFSQKVEDTKTKITSHSNYFLRQKTLKKKQLFELKDDFIFYCGKKLEDSTVKESSKILESHRFNVNNKRECLESALFCIVSQGLNFERASEFIQNVEKLEIGDLENPEFIWKFALKNKMRFKEDRYSKFYSFFRNYGGIEKLAGDFLKQPSEIRELLSKQNMYFGHKTSSFWNLCLGGNELMTLDIHNFRQIAGLNVIDIPERLYIAPQRKDGQIVSQQPSKKEYVRIENDIKRLAERVVKNHSIFLDNKGEINYSLFTTLFWWEGVKIDRGINPFQINLSSYDNSYRGILLPNKFKGVF